MYKITKVIFSMFLAYGIFGASIEDGYTSYDDSSTIASNHENQYNEQELILIDLVKKYQINLHKASKENNNIKECFYDYRSAIDKKLINMNHAIGYIRYVIGCALEEDKKQNLPSNEMIISLHQYALIKNEVERDAKIDSAISSFKSNMPANMPERYRNLLDNQIFEEYLSSKNSLSESKKFLDEALKALSETDLSMVMTLDSNLDKHFNNLASDEAIFNSGEFKEDIKDNIKEFFRIYYFSTHFEYLPEEKPGEYNPDEFKEEQRKFEERLDLAELKKNQYLQAIQQNAKK